MDIQLKYYLDDRKKKVSQIVREEFFVEEKKVYNLVVSVYTNKSWITVTLDGEKNKHIIPWPKLSKFKKYYVGITACEGINKFYNFEIK